MDTQIINSIAIGGAIMAGAAFIWIQVNIARWIGAKTKKQQADIKYMIAEGARNGIKIK
jgi:predicted aspartyl protease